MRSKIFNVKKISLLIIIFVSFMLLGSLKVEAAGFSITSGISTITVGNSYTIKVNASGLTGRFNISHSSNVSVNVSAVWIENGVPETTIKVTANSVGTATVTLSPDEDTGVSDNNGLVKLTSKTDTVTIKEKSTPIKNTTNNSSSNNTSSQNTSNKTNASNNQNTTIAPKFSSVNETVYATDSVNVRASYSTSSSIIGSLDKGDSVTRIGKATSSVNGITWSKIEYEGKTAYVSSSYLTTEKTKESSEKSLASLSIDEKYELNPKFDKNVLEYDVKVDENLDSLKIDAKSVDKNAKIEITGNDKLLTGQNTISIKVIAEDGTARTYRINVTKGDTVETKVGLSELTVDGYELSPEFSSDINEYILNISDLSVTSLNINALSDDENAKIEITGNDNLVHGENIITILITSKDGKDTDTYQITVNINEEPKTQLIAGIDDKDLIMYCGIIMVIVIIIIIAIIIIRHFRKKDDDFEPYYGGYDSLDNNIENKEFNKKNIIEENFGTDINLNQSEEGQTKRKKGKHF